MMLKSLGCILLGTAFMLASINAHSTPVVFCTNGGIDLAADGCISGASPSYPGDSDGVYSNSGGGDPEAAVEAAILAATGEAVDIYLIDKFEFKEGTLDGTWTSLVDVFYITVKAANSFALYEIGGALSGNWTTDGIFNKGGKQPGISHLSLWGVKGGVSVPEPATLGLFSVGLIGLMLSRRKKA